VEFIAEARRTVRSYGSLLLSFFFVGCVANLYALAWIGLAHLAPDWVFYFASGIGSTLGILGIVTGIFVGLFFSSVPASVNAGVAQMQALHATLLEFLRCAFDCSAVYELTGKPGAGVAETRAQLARTTKALVLASCALLGGTQVYVTPRTALSGVAGFLYSSGCVPACCGRGGGGGSPRVPYVPDPVALDGAVVTLDTACAGLCTQPPDSDDAHRILSASYHTIVEQLVRVFLGGTRDGDAVFRLLHDQLTPVGDVLQSVYMAPAARPGVFNWFVVGTIYLYTLAAPLMLVHMTWFSLLVYPVIVWIFAGPMVVRSWIHRRQRTASPYYDVRGWTAETLRRIDALCESEGVPVTCQAAAAPAPLVSGVRFAYGVVPARGRQAVAPPPGYA
jgi:hypothetical protein